jgi:hypothetical protein
MSSAAMTACIDSPKRAQQSRSTARLTRRLSPAPHLTACSASPSAPLSGLRPSRPSCVDPIQGLGVPAGTDSRASQVFQRGISRSTLRSNAGQANAPPSPPVCTRMACATPFTIWGFTAINSPPACASIWMRQVFSKVYIDRNASAIVLPTVSRPWLRSMRKLAWPRSACRRGFSSSRKATPS